MINKSKRIILSIPFIFTLLWLFFTCHPAFADSFLERFIDPEDGKFDITASTGSTKGFLPVPILVTEPAVGFGAGVSLLFFHPPKNKKHLQNGAAAQQAASEQKKSLLPPSFSGAVGIATENGTWAAGGFHFASWKQDKIRYRGGALFSSVNLAFYGGGDSPVFKNGLDYNLEGWLIFQELIFRLRSSNFFLGPRLTYYNADSAFDLNLPIEGISSWEFNLKSFGIGLEAAYDSRDNIFTPNRGIRADISSMHYNVDSEISGSRNYNIIDVSSRFYWPLFQDIIFGWRLHGGFGSGNIPFYALPFIDLRGIPALRYQGENILVTELETRWNLDERWSLIFFGGVGRTAESLSNFSDSKDRWAGGTGLRYLIARLLGLYTGIDIARGPEDWAFYIQVGSAWH